MTKPATAENVVAALAKARYSIQNEGKLQVQIEKQLQSEGFTFSREFRLSQPDRIDFLVKDGIGIEVKINRAENTLIRQAGRYLAHDEVKTLILVTIRPVNLPDILLKKPLICLALWDKLKVY